MEAKLRIDELSRQLLEYQRLYYVESRPAISDRQYDLLFDELLALEQAHPALAWPNSPTRRIGSDLDQELVDRPHTIPVLSLDKVYHAEELLAWTQKLTAGSSPAAGFTVEEKIDGASLVLYYRQGELSHALTRGNGERGNDVTENVRTIGHIPLRIEAEGELAVRGEVFLNRDDFARLNLDQETPFANPRNLAAGTLRSVRSRSVAKVPLRFIAYEAHFTGSGIATQTESLAFLATLGFPLPGTLAFFSDLSAARETFSTAFPGHEAAGLGELPAYLLRRAERRADLPYDTDGLVVKLDSIPARQELGSTAHHPRWAMAYKFDPPQAATLLRGVQVQVGRNGRVTPVAILEPVLLSGSMVSRATLHNQEYIDALELGIGDRVAISKRGDVIPAVDEVLEKAEPSPGPFRLPEHCPFCRSTLVRLGSHHFCRNDDCPERLLRSLVHFCGKAGLDIDALGEKTLALLLERQWIHSPADLFTLDWDRLNGEPGFADKKVAKLKQSLELARRQPFARVLAALGLESLGPAAIEALLGGGFPSREALVAAATRGDPAAFTAVAGIGPVLAENLIRHFSDPAVLTLLAGLEKAGLAMVQTEAEPGPAHGSMAGQEWVITGTFAAFVPRSLAAEEIARRGGRVAERMTATTTHLLCGEAPGSKLQKAAALGIPVVSEAEFKALLD